MDNNAGGAAGRLSLHAAVERVRTGRGGCRYSNVALDEAQDKHAAAEEEERAAFAAAVSDWRKGAGPVVVERNRSAATTVVAVP